MLTSISGLHRLDKLTVLRLNHNRIRKLGSGGNHIHGGGGGGSNKNRGGSGGSGGSSGGGGGGGGGNGGLSDKNGSHHDSRGSGGFGLSGLPNVEILQLGYNHVTDLSSLNLHMLSELKVLFVQGNDIVRVEGLNACYKLRELVMDKNRIKFVDGAW